MHSESAAAGKVAAGQQIPTTRLENFIYVGVRFGMLFSRIGSRAVSARSGPYETLIGRKKLRANVGVSLMFPMGVGIPWNSI